MEQRARVVNSFQLGLTGGIGVLTAIVIGAAISQTATILTYIAIALFLALGLDPVVRSLTKRKIPRPVAVGIVVVGHHRADCTVGSAARRNHNRSN